MDFQRLHTGYLGAFFVPFPRVGVQGHVPLKVIANATREFESLPLRCIQRIVLATLHRSAQGTRVVPFPLVRLGAVS